MPNTYRKQIHPPNRSQKRSLSSHLQLEIIAVMSGGVVPCLTRSGAFGLAKGRRFPHIAIMLHALNAETADELKKLYAALPDAYQRAAAALRTDPPAHILEGEALRRFLAEDEKVTAIIWRIRQIQGQ